MVRTWRPPAKAWGKVGRGACSAHDILLQALCHVQERLEREYNLDLVTTAPTVVYKCLTTKGEELTINSPADVPDASQREWMAEPYVRLEMVTPKEYVGNLMDLSNNRCGSVEVCGKCGRVWLG